MKRNLRSALNAATTLLVIALLSPLVQGAQATAGAIVGYVTNADKLPVPQATVTAISADGALYARLSAADGSYAFDNLAPGVWTLSSHVAGYPDITLPALQIAASKVTRGDIVMSVPEKPAQLAATVPLALQAPDPSPEVDDDTPFAFGDFTWLNGSPRNHAPAFDTKFFTPDVRMDAYIVDDFQHPVDHTIVGSTEEFRSGEFQLEQISLGGDFHWDHVKARFLSMDGMFATTIPRNDASSGNTAGVGQWDLQDAYRYVSEANAGYHWDVSHGLNLDVGIFASYIGLFSFYNYDNWTYQPSYVSSNTPWVFNGMRLQWFPTNKLKIEPWLINGWASYARFNTHPGFGGQILYMPTEDLKLVFNNYGIGQDNVSNAGPFLNNGVMVNYAHTSRIHTDDSIELKYYENRAKGSGLSKAAFSFTADAGCQYGGGVSCARGVNKSNFLGWMLYDRYWFHHDLYAITLGGGAMNNPGRYLTLLPPVNGATGSTGTPYFSELPGQPLYQWDSTLNFQYMPKEWITWWSELGYRHSDHPYFAGPGGVTPPGGNNGSPTNYSCQTPQTSAPTSAGCAGNGGVWYPDLRREEAMWSGGILVKF
jgi:hypothetical protein